MSDEPISRLVKRYGSHAGAVPMPAILGLRDALQGVPLEG